MASGTIFRRPAVWLVLALGAVGGLVTLLGHLAGGSTEEFKKTALTSEAGAHDYPAFSPDGKRLAYSGHAPSKDDVFHIFVRAAEGGSPLQITTGASADIGPAWSPDGASLAFLRLVEDREQVLTIPSGGGEARSLAEFDAPGGGENDDVEVGPSVAWARDGKSLVVSAPAGEQHMLSLYAVAFDGTAPRLLTKPPAESHGDTSPAVSPDGASIAFTRKREEGRDDLFVCDRRGTGVRQITYFGNPIHGVSWSPDGKELLYAADRDNGWRLWRVPAVGGSPRELLAAGTYASYPTVARAGHRVAFAENRSVSEIWIAQMEEGELLHEHPLIRSTGAETNPAFSPDGKRVANISDQSGEPQIWISDIGGQRTQLTRLEGRRMSQPQWSPDGTQLLLVAHGQNGPELFVVAAAGGKAVREADNVIDAAWSSDGKSIYYSSRMGYQIWKITPGSDQEKQLIVRRGGDPHPSPDGKYIYFRRDRSIWRAPVGGGSDGEEIFVPEHDIMGGGIQPTATGIYYLEFTRNGRHLVAAFYDFASKKSHPVARFGSRNQFSGYSISRDGKFVLYSKVDENETNLSMLENFK